MRQASVRSILAAAALTLGCGDVPSTGAEVTPGTGRVTQAVRAGGPNPAPIPLEIRNNGLCAEMDFTLTTETVDGANWLSVTPATGTIPSRGNANVLVNLDVVGPNLAPNTYTGSIRITATCRTTMTPAVGSPATVGVNLTVEGTEARLGVQDAVDQDIARIENRWSPRSVVNAPAINGNTTWSAQWTGRRLLLWDERYNVGGSYDPAGDAWTPMAAQPTSLRVANPAGARVLWANGRLYAFGGTGTNSGLVRIYDPAMNTWSSSSGATGTAPVERENAVVEWVRGRLLVWGGRVGGDQVTGSGAAWDPTANAWTALPSGGAPSGREHACAGSTGNRVMIWGGLGAQGGAVNGGAIYDAERGAWDAINLPSSTTANFHASHGRLLWTGNRFAMWATGVGGTRLRRLRVFDPVTSAWTNASANGSTDLGLPVEVWTGSRLILYVVGGEGAIVNLRTGESEALTRTDAPNSQGVGFGAWTGTSLLVAHYSSSGVTDLRRFD